jgi:hypothetical protein
MKESGMSHIIGSNGNDFLNGTNQPDIFIALDGNDTISGNNGDDVILAGSGNDTTSGNNGDDVILAGSGNDTANGNNGSDVVSGGLGNDSLFGNNGDDVLSGEEGNDNLTGGNGSDVMSGGAGDDTLTLDNNDAFTAGDEGHDTAILTGTGNFDLRGELAGLETISQGSGGATLFLNDLLFTTLEGNKLTIDLDGGNDTVSIFYNGSVLDFDKGSGEASEVIFGPTGGTLNKSIDFDNVEHLNFTNTATGATGNFDAWLLG